MFLPGESQGQRSLVGCRLWGRTESDTTESRKQLSSSSSMDADVAHQLALDPSAALQEALNLEYLSMQ